MTTFSNARGYSPHARSCVATIIESGCVTGHCFCGSKGDGDPVPVLWGSPFFAFLTLFPHVMGWDQSGVLSHITIHFPRIQSVVLRLLLPSGAQCILCGDARIRVGYVPLPAWSDTCDREGESGGSDPDWLVRSFSRFTGCQPPVIPLTIRRPSSTRIVSVATPCEVPGLVLFILPPFTVYRLPFPAFPFVF